MIFLGNHPIGIRNLSDTVGSDLAKNVGSRMLELENEMTLGLINAHVELPVVFSFAIFVTLLILCFEYLQNHG